MELSCPGSAAWTAGGGTLTFCYCSRRHSIEDQGYAIVRASSARCGHRRCYSPCLALLPPYQKGSRANNSPSLARSTMFCVVSRVCCQNTHLLPPSQLSRPCRYHQHRHADTHRSWDWVVHRLHWPQLPNLGCLSCHHR